MDYPLFNPNPKRDIIPLYYRQYVLSVNASYRCIGIGEGHMEMFKFNAEEMANLLKEAGFSKVETLGKGFTAFFHAVKE